MLKYGFVITLSAFRDQREKKVMCYQTLIKLGENNNKGKKLYKLYQRYSDAKKTRYLAH